MPIVAAATATATVTATATATLVPTATATPKPGALVVRVTPDPSRCGSGSGGCTTYVCHAPGGSSCWELIDCSGPTSWPFFALSNSGGAALPWTSSFTIPHPGGGTLSLSPSSGTLAGGASVSVTLHASENLAMNGPAIFDINFSAHAVNVDIPIQCSNG
jgi:hypothetical protein